ncbi:MAG: PAS domain-containing protein [Pseudomonadota bacterium]
MPRHAVNPGLAAVCNAASDAMAVVRLSNRSILLANASFKALYADDEALAADSVAAMLSSLTSDSYGPQSVEIHGVALAIRPELVALSDADDCALLVLRGASIRDLAERLSLAYKATSEGIWDWDVQSNELIWSERYMQMVGLDASTFKPAAETFFDQLHPDDRPRIEQAVEDHLVRKVPFDVEYRQQHVDGHYIHVHARGQALWDADGQATRMVGSVEDIREQIATRQALNETETRFQQLAENIPGAIFRYMLRQDGSHEIEYMSPGCLGIWEVDAATIEGDPAALWAMIIDEDIESVQESVAQSAETLTPWDIQFRVVTPSGNHKCLHGRGLPRRGEEGAVVWNTLVLDISDQVKMEAELRESRELFYRSQKTESLGQLTGGLAHDFNNLLAIILGNLELLSDKLDDRLHSVMLDSALNATRRGRDLTHSLLAFARRATLQPEPLAVDVVADDLTQLLKRTLPASIDFSTEAAWALPLLVVDRSAFESALLNLVLNARDAVGKTGQIRIRFDKRSISADNSNKLPPGDYVVVEVIDNGEGISDDVLSRVFEPFYTTKSEGEGSGLGLSIVDGFVNQSGGSIAITSQPGEGTTVTMLFPAYSDADTESHPIDEAEDLSRARCTHTVLVVEDEPEVRDMLCRRLESEGYRVLAADDGERGKSLLSEHLDSIDLVLTDYVMPGPVQGSDLAEFVKAANPDLPVVLLSGFVTASDLGKTGSSKSIDARLDKPVDKADLLSTLDQLITVYLGQRSANDDHNSEVSTGTDRHPA